MAPAPVPDELPDTSLTTGPLTRSAAPVWAVPVLPGAGEDPVVLGPGAEEVGEALGLDLLALCDVARATGDAGQVTTVPVTGEGPALLHLVGVGAAGTDDLRKAGAALARACRGRESVATTVPSVADGDGLEAFLAAAVLASFRLRMGAAADDQAPVGAIEVVVPDADPAPAEQQQALQRGRVLGRAGWLARHLATVPSNVKNPPWLAEQAEQLGSEHGLEVRVWDADELEADGFGGILAVGAASATPPRLVRMDYRPRGRRSRKTPHVVLVGKGITFDSGGLDIKPAEGMKSMKRDMTGGAVVLAVMSSLAALDCPVRVTGLVPAAENAISGSAMRPGDVITHYGGRTSEVGNTDAEGRLVLADALAYAVDRLAPDLVVDVATLTGAVKVALGLRTGGLFATHDAVADALSDAGRRTGEPLWRLPLSSEYADKLSSRVADATNAPSGPGALTAALFLQAFVGEVPWAHLDIASVGDALEDRDEWTTGPTGFGARLLTRWLTSYDVLEGVR